MVHRTQGARVVRSGDGLASAPRHSNLETCGGELAPLPARQAIKKINFIK